MLTVTDHETHMQRHRGPKDRPPPDHIIADNRRQWSAEIEGHPHVWACRDCPLEAARDACGQALFHLGQHDAPIAAMVLTHDPENLFTQGATT